MRVRLALTLDVVRSVATPDETRDVDMGGSQVETADQADDFPRVGFTSTRETA